MTCKTSEGILNVGIGGDVASVPLNVGIASGAQVLLTTLGIEAQSSSDPILPLAAHIGNGAVMLTWIPPLSGQPSFYEINCSTSLNGTYFPYNRSIFKNPIGLINNFPFDRTMYFRIRAGTEDGNYSNWVQAKLGILQKQSTVMRVKGPAGSTVVSGAKVAILDGVDRLAGFFASGDILL